MRFSRHRHSDGGIVIYAEFLSPYDASSWYPVRNFGDNQGEANYFMRHAAELSEQRLRMLVECFDPEVVVANSERRFGEFKRVRQTRGQYGG